MLDVDKIVVRYGPFLALNELTISVGAGEIVGVIGANGAGKSSLVRAVAGLVEPKSGTISFEGRSLTNMPPHRRTALGISLVPEGRGLFPRMSVEENLLMGGYSLSDRKRSNANIRRCFSMFPVLETRHRQMAMTLSGGQQQMLALSMGLMSDPRLLIVDEPSLGLAPIVIGDITESLKQLRQNGLTILIVEQNAMLAATIADHIYVMQAGNVLYHDTPGRLMGKPEVAESFLSI
jgi:branched-chain amino acid transport system ATP-binding protein